MGNQTVSGPTQTAVEGASKEWAPRPRVAGAVGMAIFGFPYMVGFTFAVVVGRLFPASRLGVNHIAWFIGVAVVSTLLMIPADRLVRRLVPITGLLTVALGFPDAAPSRFKAAMRSATTAQVQRRIKAALAADVVEADLDRNQYLLDLVSMLTRHDRLTRGHSERVRAYSTLMGEELRLSRSEQQKLYWATLLHDIGKLDVPSEILNKNGRPNQDEWAILQGHPAAAERYLVPLRGWLGEWGKAATEHHLRWDGKGYPRDIGGTDISFAGRVVAIADAYDVMTSARSYKQPMSAADARVELSRCAGGQFDPHLVRAFLNIGLGRVRLAGGVLVSLPALVNAVLGSLATTGGRVLLATTAVTSGVVAAPLIDIVPPAPVEVVANAIGDPSDQLHLETPTPTPPVPTPTTMQVLSAAAPVVVVPATPTPPSSAPLFEFASTPSVVAAVPTPAPVVVVPATPTAVPTQAPTVTPTATTEPFDVVLTAQPVTPTPTGTATATRVPSTPAPPPLATPTATATPTREPVATAVPATATPLPTVTRVPTATPLPTVTRVPSPTPTATATPVPTATLTPIPTATPAPTGTPVPTTTPIPTATATAVPTATATAVSECPGAAGCPLAADDAYEFVSGQRRNLHVLGNDDRQGGSQFDKSTLEIIVAPEHAVVDDFGVHNSHVHYRAAGSYVGQDSFTYQICNVDGLCDTATVTITVASNTSVPDVCTGFANSTVEFSFDEDRRDGWGLDGAAFVGPDTELFIFATVPETTTAVRFYVDDRSREDPPANIDTSCAYDLLSADGNGPAERGIMMSELGNGFHTITIVVVDADNSETVRHADFGVLVLGRGPTPTPTPVPAPTATATPVPTPVPIPQGIGSDCAAAQLGELDLAGADLGNCDLAGLDLSDAELAGAKLQGANLAGVNLSGVNLTGAQVQGANFENANLSFADLDEAHLQGSNFANVNGTGAQLSKATMQGANLVGADFSGAKFDEAKLQDADLSQGNFSGAQLIKVNLNDANLSGADLRGTNFKEAKLHRADITGALIEDTSFDQAELNEANLLGAIGTPLADGADATFAQTICPDGAITSVVGCWD